jgi:hypothetical protein
MSLKDDIAKLLNIVSAENASDTPDFILGEYLVGCLDAFDRAVKRREEWYGRPCGSGKSIMGVQVIVDPGMPPGTIELRSPKSTVRVENLAPFDTEAKAC